MINDKKFKDADEFIKALDKAAIGVKGTSQEYGIIDDGLIQKIIWNIEMEALLEFDDRQFVLDVFAKMDSERQAGIKSSLIDWIEDQKNAIDKFKKGELPEHESNPSIESLQQVLDGYLEFAKDLGLTDL